MFKLELDSIISSNKSFFEWIIKNDGVVSIGQLHGAIKMIDLRNLVSDYVKLFDQINLLLQNNKTIRSPQLIQAVNSAIKSDRDFLAGEYISPYIEKNTKYIISDISSRLMEINQIYRTIQLLNLMPGTNGKPINLFKLPDYQ